ncbi:MAG: glycosyltransferase [Candidatus Omnitrophota bacterium]
MNILHIVRQFYPCVGGVEKYVLCLAREQLKIGNKVSVLTLNKNFCNNETLTEEETYEGINIKRIPFWGSRRYPIAISCIRYLDDYDLVNIHCVDFFIDYLVLMKHCHNKKIILCTHGGYFHTKWLRILKIIYFNTITRAILCGCNKIIANSENDYRLFSKITSNINWVNNGVEIEKFNVLEKYREKSSLLYVGRIDEHKGIGNLIGTVAVLIKNGYAVNLKIIGSDWKGIKCKLESIADSLNIRNSVIFMGQLTDAELLREMVKANIFVSASEYEAFGISAVEAMASGTPCVLNDIESFRYFINNSNSGLIVNFSDPEKAAKAISEFLEMDQIKYNMMSMNAKEWAKQYSWNKVAERILCIYKEVLCSK